MSKKVKQKENRRVTGRRTGRLSAVFMRFSERFRKIHLLLLSGRRSRNQNTRGTQGGSRIQCSPRASCARQLHMQHAGYPLVCDNKYNEAAYWADSQWCPRLFLHHQAPQPTRFCYN